MATIFLSAGEASGDHYGAEVMAVLRVRRPEVEFFGLGGLAMAGAGLERVVRAEDVAVMGVTEIVRHVPRILREYRRLVRAIRERRPAVAVLIDFPDVNFRLAKQLKRIGVPVVWFVSPQLWAWKRGRLRWVQERVDRMLVIFPFEERFYRARGVEAEFVGHPLAGESSAPNSREAFAAKAAELHQDQWKYVGPLPLEDSWAKPNAHGSIRYSLDSSKPWIALLPGSRLSEVRQNLPAMVEAAYEISGDYEFLVPVAPTITKEQLVRIQYDTGDLFLSRPKPPRITFVSDARGALSHARASVVASGTATVLAAVVGNPFVVVYRVSPMTFRVAKRLVRYPEEIPAERDADGVLPVAMVNLLAGRRVVPELINERFTAERVVAELRPLLAEGPARAAQIDALRAVRESLWPVGDGRTLGTERVAEVVLELMDRAARDAGAA